MYVNLMRACYTKENIYHYKAMNVYNYTAVHNTPNGPAYTVGHNAPNTLELY